VVGVGGGATPPAGATQTRTRRNVPTKTGGSRNRMRADTTKKSPLATRAKLQCDNGVCGCAGAPKQHGRGAKYLPKQGVTTTNASDVTKH
jgi:hypothetical protein